MEFTAFIGWMTETEPEGKFSRPTLFVKRVDMILMANTKSQLFDMINAYSGTVSHKVYYFISELYGGNVVWECLGQDLNIEK